MSRIDVTNELIDGVVARVPAEFGLRAFPGRRFRVCREKCFLSESVEGGPVRVQIVVQVRSGADWQDFGRDTIETLQREVVA